MGLKFKDIGKEWKPTSISIVDKPSHPLAVFEVYEDDDEFIKKYSPNDEVDKLSNQKEVNDETVTMSSSFFEKLFGGLVSKAEPPEPPEDEGKKDGDKLDEIISKLEAFEERISKLENPEEAPGAVAKSEGASTGDGGEGGESAAATEGQAEANEGEEGNKEEEEEKPVVDENTMVKKSKEVDPDLNKGTVTTESLMKRIGRSEDGMKW